MVNFGPLAAEIVSLVWGIPGNFNWFHVLVALLHGTLVVGISQTAALNRGRHLYLAGWPSRWALAHISSSSFCLIGFPCRNSIFWLPRASVSLARASVLLARTALRHTAWSHQWQSFSPQFLTTQRLLAPVLAVIVWPVFSSLWTGRMLRIAVDGTNWYRCLQLFLCRFCILTLHTLLIHLTPAYTFQFTNKLHALWRPQQHTDTQMHLQLSINMWQTECSRTVYVATTPGMWIVPLLNGILFVCLEILDPMSRTRLSTWQRECTF